MKVNVDDKIGWIRFYSERLPTQPKPAGDHKYNACCPFHQEHNPSFWFNTTNGMWKCESGCGSGNATTFLSRLENIDTGAAWEKLCKLAGVDAKQPEVKLPLTLEMYAGSKKLPLDFLRGLGLGEQGATEWVPGHVTIPYYDSDGACVAVRQRRNPNNRQRFAWNKGGTPIVYGAWLDLNKTAKALLLVEGESDAQSCWLHGLPALGIPGATNYQAAWTARYIGDRDVYIHVEPDAGGQKFREKTMQALYDSGYAGKVRTFSAHAIDQACKDPSDLHIKYGDQFRAMIDPALKAAQPLDLAAECIKIHEAKPTQPEAKTIKKLQVYHAADLYGKTIERPPTIVQGMIPAGLTVLAGAPKRGKSWLSLMLALCVAGGEPFLGAQTTQGDVLYLDLESKQYRVQDRLRKLIVGRAPESLYITHESDRLEAGLRPGPGDHQLPVYRSRRAGKACEQAVRQVRRDGTDRMPLAGRDDRGRGLCDRGLRHHRPHCPQRHAQAACGRHQSRPDPADHPVALPRRAHREGGGPREGFPDRGNEHGPDGGRREAGCRGQKARSLLRPHRRHRADRAGNHHPG